ncbi:hypothetical protein BUALT_Bualt12G0123500 [Buddleja alternifolia]|uniref:Glycosyltransferase n=1 Tax=Buddleja alternifolia TaxID=168488 RepID=A0AAV6WQU6_9LAMI|nr:hypothetical protein BUALT_Bualt12G0123500 [Buddleja alternifolia]
MVDKSKSSFSEIISNLNPDLVIYDIFQLWAAKIASSKGIPAVHFAAFGAATVSFIHHHYGCCDETNPFPELSLTACEKKSYDAFIEFRAINVTDNEKDGFMANCKLSSDIVMLKTSRGFEGKYIDYYSDVCNKKLLTVGPLVSDASDKNDEENSEILQWLSKKNRYSTVYISFGSEHFLSNDEIEEIAKGLELCDVNFIWIIRFPIEDKRIRMPMKLNMFIDARMLGDAGVCVEVRRDESNVFKGEEIARAVNKVILDKSGEGIRLRARELSEKMKSEEEKALDETAEQLWQIWVRSTTEGNRRIEESNANPPLGTISGSVPPSPTSLPISGSARNGSQIVDLQTGGDSRLPPPPPSQGIRIRAHPIVYTRRQEIRPLVAGSLEPRPTSVDYLSSGSMASFTVSNLGQHTTHMISEPIPSSPGLLPRENGGLLMKEKLREYLISIYPTHYL